MINKLIITISVMIAFPFLAKAQYTVAPDRTAEQLMDRLLVGEGMSVHNVALICDEDFNATFVGEGVPFLDSGVVLSVGKSANLFTNEPGFGFTVNDTLGWRGTGDADLNATIRDWGVDTLLLSFRTCKLTFDMVPYTDTVKMDFVYTDTKMSDSTFVLQDGRLREGCRPAVDIIGMLVTGGSEGYLKQNFAVFPGTDVPVNLFTLMKSTDHAPDFYANCRDSTLWVDAPYDEYYFYIYDSVITAEPYPYFRLDAISRKITPVIPVTPCDTYSVKLAIAKHLILYTGAEWGTEPPDALSPSLYGGGSAFLLSNLRGVGTPVFCLGDSSSSIGEMDRAAATLQPYPNPASTILYLDVADISAAGHLYIVDPLGRICYETEVTQQQVQLQIPISTLSPGLYQVLLRTDKGQHVGKFVKE